MGIATLNPPQLRDQIMSIENNIWQDDYLDRSASSKFLTSYILANPHIKVINVNSPWDLEKHFSSLGGHKN